MALGGGHDLHGGAVLGGLAGGDELDDVVGDGEEPPDLLLPPLLGVRRHGLQLAVLAEHGRRQVRDRIRQRQRRRHALAGAGHVLAQQELREPLLHHVQICPPRSTQESINFANRLMAHQERDEPESLRGGCTGGRPVAAEAGARRAGGGGSPVGQRGSAPAAIAVRLVHVGGVAAAAAAVVAQLAMELRAVLVEAMAPEEPHHHPAHRLELRAQGVGTWHPPFAHRRLRRRASSRSPPPTRPEHARRDSKTHHHHQPTRARSKEVIKQRKKPNQINQLLGGTRTCHALRTAGRRCATRRRREWRTTRPRSL